MSLGPNAGVEIFVPGRQDVFAGRTLIPFTGAPISFRTSSRISFIIVSDATGFYARADCHRRKTGLARVRAPGWRAAGRPVPERVVRELPAAVGNLKLYGSTI